MRARTFSIQFSDKKPVKTILANTFDDALEMAAGKRFFSASSDSYRRSGDVTTDKFFNVMVKDPDGTTTYKSGRKLIRLKNIRAQVSLFEIPKSNPRASNPQERSLPPDCFYFADEPRNRGQMPLDLD